MDEEVLHHVHALVVFRVRGDCVIEPGRLGTPAARQGGDRRGRAAVEEGCLGGEAHALLAPRYLLLNARTVVSPPCHSFAHLRYAHVSKEN